jgi:hypothetical protein
LEVDDCEEVFFVDVSVAELSDFSFFKDTFFEAEEDPPVRT